MTRSRHSSDCNDRPVTSRQSLAVTRPFTRECEYNRHGTVSLLRDRSRHRKVQALVRRGGGGGCGGGGGWGRGGVGFLFYFFFFFLFFFFFFVFFFLFFFILFFVFLFIFFFCFIFWFCFSFFFGFFFGGGGEDRPAAPRVHRLSQAVDAAYPTPTAIRLILDSFRPISKSEACLATRPGRFEFTLHRPTRLRLESGRAFLQGRALPSCATSRRIQTRTQGPHHGSPWTPLREPVVPPWSTAQKAA